MPLDMRSTNQVAISISTHLQFLGSITVRYAEGVVSVLFGHLVVLALVGSTGRIDILKTLTLCDRYDRRGGTNNNAFLIGHWQRGGG